jgi:hypothetical protein
VTAAQYDRTAPTEGAAPGRTWTDQNRHHALVVEETEPTDTDITVWVADESGDGPGVQLTVEQVRELIGALIDRVDLIGRPPLHGTNWDGETF